MGNELLTLPFAIQIALGTGYLAYLIAYAGIRQHHTATDAVFRSIAFGLAASWIIYFAPSQWWSTVIAIASPLLLAVLWRWRGMAWSKGLLRKYEVNWTDDIPTAWLSIVAEDTQSRPSQIAIDLDNGRTLVCEDTRRFVDAPHGPCKFGLDGSLAIYVTAEMRANGEWFEHANIRDPIDGDRMTFVPATAIRRVEIRFWTKANVKAAPAEERVQDVEAGPEATTA